MSSHDVYLFMDLFKGIKSKICSVQGKNTVEDTMKLFECVIDSRLWQEWTISEYQHGFRSGCGSKDLIFVLRLEKYMAFFDLQKTFHSISRQIIWWALKIKNKPMNNYYSS